MRGRVGPFRGSERRLSRADRTARATQEPVRHLTRPPRPRLWYRRFRASISGEMPFPERVGSPVRGGRDAQENNSDVARRFSLSEARRIALAAQGFDRPRPGGKVGLRYLSRTIKQIGLLQIDYVNVLVPVHYQVPFSRPGPYDKTLLDELVYRRREFTEQWAHEASIVPIEIWPLLHYRRANHRVRPKGSNRFWQNSRSMPRGCWSR